MVKYLQPNQPLSASLVTPEQYAGAHSRSVKSMRDASRRKYRLVGREVSWST
jgi:hypothetical protein